MKTCTKCGVERALADFPRAPKMKSGLDSWCRPCRRLDMRARRESNGAVYNQARRRSRSAQPERFTLRDMVRRCTNPRRKDFKHYGGRGISVCPEWQGEGGFERFLAHVGARPSPRHSIDRINNDGDYEPGNVRWSTQKEQLAHWGRTRRIDAFGRSQTLAQWAEELGVPPRLIHQRLDMLGWTPEDAVSLQPREKRAA